MKTITHAFPLIKYLALALLLAVSVLTSATLAEPAFAEDRTGYETTTTTITTENMKTIAPERAQMVMLKLKAAGGTSGTTCCTHWNTSTGGTGCASFPDSCPSGQFEVSCGANGCW